MASCTSSDELEVERKAICEQESLEEAEMLPLCDQESADKALQENSKAERGEASSVDESEELVSGPETCSSSEDEAMNGSSSAEDCTADPAGSCAAFGIDMAGESSHNLGAHAPGKLAKGVLRFNEGLRNTRYQAVAVIQALRIFSRKIADLGRVLEFHMVLTETKQRMAVEGASAWEADECGDGDECQPFEVRFNCALRAALDEHGISEEEMRPRCIVSVPTKYWTGEHLYTPDLSIADGLRTWRRLTAARGRVYMGCPGALLRHMSPGELEEVWVRLREAHIEVLREHGQSMRDVEAQISRMDRLHVSRQPMRERHEQLWNVVQMAREDRRAQACLRHELRLARRAEQERQVRARQALRQARRERARMEREELRQRAVERAEARREARERRRMAYEERSLRRGLHWESRAPAAERAMRRIAWLLARWRAHERFLQARERSSQLCALRRRAREEREAARAAREAARRHREAEHARRREARRVAAARRAQERRDLTMEEILGPRCAAGG